MEPIRDTIKTLLEDWQEQKKGLVSGEPQGLLKKVFSVKELKHLRFVSLKRGALSIRVDSSGWLYQLNLQKEQLLEKIAKEAPEIKSLRFSVGNVAPEQRR
jgi:predicted nucleic acid-binding Zn ribbon protein